MVKQTLKKGIIFIGDSYDDYQTVVNFKKKYADNLCEFVQVLENNKPFGPDISYLKNVNQLLEFLIRENKYEKNKN
jgi:hypothetical protein